MQGFSNYVPERNYPSEMHNIASYSVVQVYGTCNVISHQKTLLLLLLLLLLLVTILLCIQVLPVSIIGNTCYGLLSLL